MEVGVGSGVGKSIGVAVGWGVALGIAAIASLSLASTVAFIFSLLVPACRNYCNSKP